MTAGGQERETSHVTVPPGEVAPGADSEPRQTLLTTALAPGVDPATSAVLTLTHGPWPREVLESDLLAVVDGGAEPQARELAVTCLGHVARMHRTVSSAVIGRLTALTDDELLGGRAQDALDDVAAFVPAASGPER